MSLHIKMGSTWITSAPGAGERPWSSALAGWVLTPERTIQVDSGAGWLTKHFCDLGQQSFSLGFDVIRELESDLEAALWLAQMASRTPPHPIEGTATLTWVSGAVSLHVYCNDSVIEARQARPIGSRSVKVSYVLRGGVMNPDALAAVVPPTEVIIYDEGEDPAALESEFGSILIDEN